MDTRIALSGVNPDVYGALMRGYQGAMLRQQDQQQQQDRKEFRGALSQRHAEDPTAGVLARTPEGQSILQEEQKQREFAYTQNKDAAPVMFSIAERFSQIPESERAAAAQHVYKVMSQSNPVVAEAMREQFTDLSDAGINGVMTGYQAFAPQGPAEVQKLNQLARIGNLTPEQLAQAARVEAGIEARPEPVSSAPQPQGAPFADSQGLMTQLMINPDGTTYEVKTGSRQFQPMPGYVGEAIMKASDDYNAATMKAESADRMAVDFSTKFANVPAGAAGSAAESVKSFFGTQDDISNMRREWISLKNSLVAEQLPPGVASDRDIAIIKAGFPDDFSNTRALAEFLKARANVLRGKAEYEGFKSWYLSENQTTRGLLGAWKKAKETDSASNLPVVEGF